MYKKFHNFPKNFRLLFFYFFLSVFIFIIYFEYLSVSFPNYDYKNKKNYEDFFISTRSKNFELKFDFFLYDQSIKDNHVVQNIIDTNLSDGGIKLEIKRSPYTNLWILCSYDDSNVENCLTSQFLLTNNKWFNVKIKNKKNRLSIFINDIFVGNLITNGDLKNLVIGYGLNKEKLLNGKVENIKYINYSKKRLLILFYIFFSLVIFLFLNLKKISDGRN